MTALVMGFQPKERRRKEVKYRCKDEGSKDQNLLKKKKQLYLGLKGRWEGAKKRFCSLTMGKIPESTITLQVNYSPKLPMHALVHSGSKSSSVENL